MRKIICAPENIIQTQLAEDTKYFSTYSNPHKENIGYFAPTLINDLNREGIQPTGTAWDFTTIGLSVAAADYSLTRHKSADAWTRQIDLTICLYEPSVWEPVKEQLQNTLRFLTGDFWKLTFMDGGVAPPQIKKRKDFDSDCVSLLSGGVDSLVGAIDIVEDAYKPVFISQTVRGNAKTQKDYAHKIRQQSPHFQWSHKIHPPKGESEGSTRSRSIVFFAFAALAASAINSTNGSPININIPENGFISLNIPVNSGRMGSYSTKTTHPVYLAGLQKIWSDVGMNLKLTTPYRFKTKGELLSECKNKNLLYELIDCSTSCGKYLRYGHQHCGRCLPCIVRRSAFLRAGISDNTNKEYKFDNLSSAGLTQGANDVGAMAAACHRIRKTGINSIIAGNLSFSQKNVKQDYENLLSRGFKEIEALFKKYGVL